MAVYRITNKKDGTKRLIETRTKVSAIGHVSGDDYNCEALNTRELVQEIQNGLKVETLTKEEAEGEEPKEGTPAFAKKAAAAAAPAAKPAPATTAPAHKTASAK